MIANPHTNMSAMQNSLPIEILHPEDIANAVAFLSLRRPSSSPTPSGRWTQTSRSDDRRGGSARRLLDFSGG